MAHPVPSAGTDVQVVVIVPPARADGCEGRLFGKGVAVRVEHEDGRPAGFAAEVLSRPWRVSSSLPRPLGGGKLAGHAQRIPRGRISTHLLNRRISPLGRRCSGTLKQPIIFSQLRLNPRPREVRGRS